MEEKQDFSTGLILLLLGTIILAAIFLFKGDSILDSIFSEEDQMTPTLISTTTPEFYTVMDDQMVLSVELPTTWKDSEGQAIRNEENLIIGNSLYVAPSMQNYFKYLNSSGISLTAFTEVHSEALMEDDSIQNQDDFLDEIDVFMSRLLDERGDDVNDLCLYYGRETIQTDSLIGSYDTYSNCNSSNEDLTFYLATLRSPNEFEKTVILVEYRAQTKQEQENFDSILSSVQLLDSVTIETTKLPSYHAYWSNPSFSHESFSTQTDSTELLSFDLPVEYTDSHEQTWVTTKSDLPIGYITFFAPDLDQYFQRTAPGLTISTGVVDYSATELIVQRRNYYQFKFGCDFQAYDKYSATNYVFWIYTIHNCEKTDLNFKIAGSTAWIEGKPFFILIEQGYLSNRDIAILEPLLDTIQVDASKIFENGYIRFPQFFQE